MVSKFLLTVILLSIFVILLLPASVSAQSSVVCIPGPCGSGHGAISKTPDQLPGTITLWYEFGQSGTPNSNNCFSGGSACADGAVEASWIDGASNYSFASDFGGVHPLYKNASNCGFSGSNGCNQTFGDTSSVINTGFTPSSTTFTVMALVKPDAGCPNNVCTILGSIGGQGMELLCYDQSSMHDGSLFQCGVERASTSSIFYGSTWSAGWHVVGITVTSNTTAAAILDLATDGAGAVLTAGGWTFGNVTNRILNNSNTDRPFSGKIAAVVVWANDSQTTPDMIAVARGWKTKYGF